MEIIGREMYYKNVCWCEDRIVNFALFRIANSFKFIKIIGIIHYKNPKSVGQTWRNKNISRIFHDELLNVMNIYKLTQNTEDSMFAALEFKNIWHFSRKGLTNENKELAKNIYNKILNDPYVPEQRKKIIIKMTGGALN